MVRIIKLVSYFYVYQTLFSLLFLLTEYNWKFTTIIDSLARGTAINQSTTYLSLAMVLSGIAMLWHLIHFQYVKFSLKSFGEVSGKIIGLSIPLILSGMIFVNLCSEFIGLPDRLQDTFLAMSSNIFGILSITIMAPLVEELLFRGAIQGYLLRTGMKPTSAILISSFIFGIIHLNPAQIPFAFAIGLIFGWLYYRTGSLVPGIVGHFINNSIACIQMATIPKEELNTTTFEWLGEGPTYALLAVSFAVMVGMFLYLKKKLPPALVNTEKNEPTSNMKEEKTKKKFNFQTKASAKRNKEKEYAYIQNATYFSIFFAYGKLVTTFIKIKTLTTYSLDLIVSDICQIVALCICAVCIGIISHNVKQKRVFIQTTANLIKVIGITVSLSGPIPPFICMFIANVTNIKELLSYYPNWYLIVTGSFIYALGYIYQYAIKIKEEQDLTI